MQELKTAITKNDLEAVQRIIDSSPEAKQQINDGTFDWSMPALGASHSQEMVDLLIRNGATLNAISKWWAPGFGAHQVQPVIADYLIKLGAEISPHAAAAIGLEGNLEELLNNDPSLVTAPGGDGCHPLHFARETGIVQLLFEHEADLDARDEDHESTPAQWRIKDSPEVVKLLLQLGSTPDIFLAAGLGDLNLAKALIKSDPFCTTQRIGNNEGQFPGIGFKGRGGTIYQWTLGFNLSPHEVALKNGHQAIYELLLENTPPRHKLLVAATSANRTLAEAIIIENPNLISELDAEDTTLLAKFCWETNINIDAVRLMLDLGFPVDVPEPNHGFMALHNAAWCGNPELVQLLLDHGHPLDRRDPEFKASAMGFAIHSCTQAKRHPDGQFVKVVELLKTAGVPVDDHHYTCGDAAIEAILDKK